MSSGQNFPSSGRTPRKAQKESPPYRKEKTQDARRSRSDHEKSHSDHDLSRSNDQDRDGKKKDMIKPKQTRSPRRSKESFYDRKPVGPRKDAKVKSEIKDKIREKKMTEVTVRHALFQDNSRLAQLIAQITNSDEDISRRLAAVQSLIEYVYDAAHLEPVKRNCSNIFSALEEVFLDRGFNELKDKIITCYAAMGYVLGIDCDKFFQWVFSRIPSAASDQLRVMYLKTISEAVLLDTEKQVFYNAMSMIMASLQDVLENADAPELLLVILDVLVVVARDYPHIFAEYFRDTVDILVGWHIDTTQGKQLMLKTADCLISFHSYWISDMRFSLTLLGQFLEDMEAYAEELSSITSGKFSKEDTPSPYVSLPKLTALTRVFTTVVSGLGEFFSPGRESKITAHYITETIDRIIGCVDISNYDIKFEKLLIAANNCLSVLANSLGQSINVTCKKLFSFVNSQLEKKEITNELLQSSLLLAEKIVCVVGQSLPFNVVPDIIGTDKPCMKLRLTADGDNLVIMLNIFQTLLSVKNLTLLETIYKLLVQDLVAAYRTLLHTDALQDSADLECIELVHNNNLTVNDAHTIVVFDLAALAEIATFKSSVIGAWKVNPPTYTLLTSILDPMNSVLSNQYPDVQFAILSALFCHSQRCNNFVPSAKSKTTAHTPESTHLIQLVCKLLIEPQVCGDTKCLCLVWLSSIADSIAALPLDIQKRQWNLIPVVDALTLSTYSLDAKVREESANCIAKMTTLGITHPIVLGRLLVECLPHLLDTDKIMSDKYRKLVMSFPADLLASLSSHSTQLSKRRFIGSSESPQASCKDDLWLVCKKHMCTLPSGTLSSHSFKTIMSFLLTPQALKCKETWTEDVFNSCQRLGKLNEPVAGNLSAFQRFSASLDANFPPNIKSLDSVLWFWLSWEAAEFCILSRLKTPLGKALDTFQSIEGVLKGLESRFREKIKVNSILNKSYGDPKEKNKEYLRSSVVVHQAVLLLQFLEHLEKLMYNAYEGTASSLPQANRAVRTFFRTNRSTCCEWVNRIQGSMTILANMCGCPEKAVRSGYLWLQHLKNTGNTQGKEFEHAVVTVVDALIQLHCYESINGILEWSRRSIGRHFFWLSGAPIKARGSLESAADVFKVSLTKYLSPDRLKSENVNEPKKATVTLLLKDPVINADSLSTQFLVGQATDCYLQLCDWSEVQEWNKQVNELQKKFTSVQGLYSTIDHSYVRAMMKFEEHDFAAVHEQLELIPGANVASMLHEQFPVLGTVKEEKETRSGKKMQEESVSTTLADNLTPQAMLCQSRIFLMQALTLYWTSGLNTLKGSEVGSLHSSEWETVEELLSESSEAAITPLRSMLLNQSSHSAAPFLMQLKSIAAIRDALIATDIDQDADVTFMNVYGHKQYIDANKTDISILNEALRTTSYLQCHHSLHKKGWVGTTAILAHEKLPNVQTLQVMTAKLARKQGNKKLAESLLAKQLSLLETKGAIDGKMYLTGGAQLKLKQLSASVSSGKVVDPLAAVDILRESAKLKLTLGNVSEAIDVLCSSILLSERQLIVTSNKSGSNAMVKLSEISARSFLTLAKWIYSENRVQSPVSDFDDTVTVGPKVREVVKISTKSGGSLSRVLQGASVSVASMSEGDAICGQLLFHSSFRCPSLGKTWFNFADWCYKWGRKTVEVESSSSTSFELMKEERDAICKILPKDTPASVIDKVIGVISTSVHHRDTTIVEGEPIEQSEGEVNENDIEKVKRRLVCATEELVSANSEIMESLLTLWQGVVGRVFSHFQQAAVAYFTYLRLTGAQSFAPPDVIKRNEYGNITATLRLLRLLVKYSSELKHNLEQSFTQTPTKPWRSIIPQLFARLNHPENYVASTVAGLICRIAQDSPELIVYPTVVGCSDMMPQQQLTKTSAEGILRAYQYEEHDECEQPAENASVQDDLDVISQVDTEGTASQEEQFAISLEDKAILSSLHVILDTLNTNNSKLVQEVKCVVSELRRITLLWDELWYGSLAQLHQEAQRRIQQLTSEIKRVHNNKTLSDSQKSSLIREKHAALMKPLFYSLERLHKITSQPPETPHEEAFQSSFGTQITKAIDALKNPVDPSAPEHSWEPTKQLYQTLQARALKRATNNLSMCEISPILAKNQFQLVSLPGIVSSLDENITLKHFSNDVQILPTKTKPKKLVMHASDGQLYAYLFKGLEDLHLDERIMQFLEICNYMFAKECKSGERNYFARHYSVTPLGPRSGLIQWVDGATPLFTLYRRWQQREASASVLLKNQADKSGATVAPTVPARPSELFYNKINPLLKEKNIDSTSSSRKDWPLSILRKALQDLSNETPADLLSRELWCASTNPSDWWSMMQSYSRSAAVMSVIGYVLGLGDRHLDNILIDLTTGEVVHIDYNVCFEKGKALRVPEKVPFRMTRNMETALGVTGVEGIFRSCCEKVMQFLRQGREILLTLLEAFVYDPLIDWTTANDAAFAGAFYGGGGAIADDGNKFTRKEMERGITQTLLSTRIAEMRVSWNANKDELINSLNKLRELLVTFCQTFNSQWYANEEFELLQNQASLLKAALVKTSHPLHSLQSRYDKQAKLLCDLNLSKARLKEKLLECDQIQKQFQNAYANICDKYIHEMYSEVCQQPGVGPPCYAPAVKFLNSAGQSNVVVQFEQLESELLAGLKQRRAALGACIEVVLSYVDIVHQFGDDYMHHHLLSTWIKLLSPLFPEPTSEKCKSALSQYQEVASKKKVIFKDVEPLVRALEIKLNQYFNEQNGKLNKLVERRRHEHEEVSLLSGPVTETWNALRRFTGDAGLPGAISLACVTVTALTTLNKRQLVMENAAAVVADRLMHLTSRDGDWFLDELCTMCGNISQLLSVLKNNALRLSPQKNNPNTDALESITTGMHVVFAALKAYNGLQEFISNFRTMIIPQTVQLFLANDHSLFKVIDSVREVVDSSSLSLPKIVEAYEKSCTEKSHVSEEVTATVDNLHHRFEHIMEPISNRNEEDGGETSKLSAGQSLLGDFSNLFVKFEGELVALYESYRKLKVSDGYDHLDSQSEQRKLKKSKQMFSSSTTKWLNLLFAKKLSVIQGFFDACLQQSGATRDIDNGMKAVQKLARDPYTSPVQTTNFSVFNEDLLSLSVKQYVAEAVQSFLIGIPSQALTSLSISYIGLLASAIAKDVRDGRKNIYTMEEICKKVVDYNLKSGNFPHHHLSQASVLINAHDAAWRKHDLARRLDASIASQKEVVDRAQVQLVRFQWLHEEALFSTVNMKKRIPSASPAKQSTINELKKRLQVINQTEQSMVLLMERYAQLQASIEQRLRWASGANPALNVVLHNFGEAVVERKALLQKESNLTPEVHLLASSVIKMETFRANVNDASIFDQTIVSYLQECEIACRTFESCMEDLGDVEHLMRSLQIPIPPTEPITLNWMKTRLDFVKTQMKDVLGRAPTVKSAILTEREVLKSQISACKSSLTSHHTLVGEVKAMLKTLAKDEEAEECWNVRRFIQAHNKFSEDSSIILKKMLNVASTSRPDTTEELTRLNEEEANTIEIMINDLISVVYSLHDHLLSFGMSKLEPNNESSTRPYTLPLVDSVSDVKEVVQTEAENSPLERKHLASHLSPDTPNTSKNTTALTPKKNVPGNFTRDPKTGKALQERNIYALNVWKRVRTKLEGRDVDSNRRVAVPEQVNNIIAEAISEENLCQLYEGWTPWV